jgi:hypothetical protein
MQQRKRQKRTPLRFTGALEAPVRTVLQYRDQDATQ